MADRTLEWLDKLILETLAKFASWVVDTGWYGREREAVSAYAMGFLCLECGKPGRLKSPAQLGIEVAVPQLPGEQRKQVVCKDLVMWEKPFDTVWDQNRRPVNRPMCIIEWKRASCSAEAKADREWLREYSGASTAPFLGYSVVFDADAKEKEGVIRVARIRDRTIEQDCLTAP